MCVLYDYNNPYLNDFINGYNYGTQYLYPTTRSPNWYRNNRSATRVKSFSKEEAAAIALLLGIDFNKSKFDLDEFWMGVNTELEHGKISSQKLMLQAMILLLLGKLHWLILTSFLITTKD